MNSLNGNPIIYSSLPLVRASNVGKSDISTIQEESSPDKSQSMNTFSGSAHNGKEWPNDSGINHSQASKKGSAQSKKSLASQKYTQTENKNTRMRSFLL